MIGYCLKCLFGAGRGNRTPMMSPSRDFESRASTNSAIPAVPYFISGQAQLLLKIAGTAT